MNHPLKHLLAALLLSIGLITAAGPARAGIPVIDIAAITQLIQQVTYWTQQIQHMVTQVNQLRTTYESISGQRGMGQLLPLDNAARNYLPEDWQGVMDSVNGLGNAYAGAAGQVQAVLAASAVLTDAQLAEFTPEQRALVDDARKAAAGLQGLSRTAYATTSQRFTQLQQLLAAISTTGDQKAILELQARIQSEQTMLQNEQTKLATLYQIAQAQQWTRAQQVRELTVKGVGTLKTLPPKAY